MAKYNRIEQIMPEDGMQYKANHKFRLCKFVGVLEN